MSPNAEPRTDAASILDDLERRVQEAFSAQKTEVEQSLAERINREKEEAQRRIDAVNREFAQVRGFLEEHKAVMAELQSTEEHLRGEIRGHFERAVNYQKMMENAAILAGGELEKIGGLNEEIEKVRVRAESEYAGLKDQLSGYAGIVAQLPAPASRTESEVDWLAEIGKLRQVRDLLATLHPADADAAPDDAADGAPSAPATETAEELAASLGLIGIDDERLHDVDLSADNPARADFQPPQDPPALDEAVAAAVEEAEAEARAEAAAQAEAPAEAGLEPEAEAAPARVEDDPAALENLERYRRTEPVVNGTELAFYAAGTGSWLDARAFMDAVDKVVDGAQQLHSQLTETTSVKDLFLLKQEILNQQEVLRKVFFRIVRFCDKEDGRLPGSLDEIIGPRGLKDVIERLTMANWSDPSDFKPFLNELKAMKRAFDVRTNSDGYLRTVLDEVEGREN